MRQALEAGFADISTPVEALSGKRGGNDVRDEAPVGAELQHNGAQQVILGGRPGCVRLPSLAALVGLLQAACPASARGSLETKICQSCTSFDLNGLPVVPTGIRQRNWVKQHQASLSSLLQAVPQQLGISKEILSHFLQYESPCITQLQARLMHGSYQGAESGTTNGEKHILNGAQQESPRQRA